MKKSNKTALWLYLLPTAFNVKVVKACSQRKVLACRTFTNSSSVLKHSRTFLGRKATGTSRQQCHNECSRGPLDELSIFFLFLSEDASSYYFTNRGTWAKYLAFKKLSSPVKMESVVNDGFASSWICLFHYNDCCNKPSPRTKPDM